MTNRIAVFAGMVFVGMGISESFAACPGTPLQNGQTADATDVMDWLDCKAPLENPSFSGAISIGSASSSASRLNINGPYVSAFGQASITASDSYGYLSLDGPSGAGIFYRLGGALKWDVGTSSGGGAFTFYNHGIGSEAARFGSDNSFLVGTTANGGWSGNAIAEMRTSRQFGTSFYQVNNNGGYAAASFRIDYAGLLLAGFYYSSSQVGNITTNGTTTAYNTSSDARLKSNVLDLAAAKSLRALQAYRPQEYLIRGKPGVGALAQDVDRRMSAIGIDAVGFGLVTRGDANVRLREGQPGFRQWGMDSAKMIPFVIATTLNQEGRIQALESENAKLARQVRDLKRVVETIAHRSSLRTASN